MTKKNNKLDAIINKVGLQQFLMCVGNILHYGYNSITPENTQTTVESIRKQDDTNSFMTNDFQIMIVETSLEIVQAVEPMELIKIASKYIK